MDTRDLMVADERALLARHAAAIQLLREGREVDGPLVLSYVIWPSPALVAAALSDSWNDTAPASK